MADVWVERVDEDSGHIVYEISCRQGRIAVVHEPEFDEGHPPGGWTAKEVAEVCASAIRGVLTERDNIRRRGARRGKGGSDA